MLRSLCRPLAGMAKLARFTPARTNLIRPVLSQQTWQPSRHMSLHTNDDAAFPIIIEQLLRTVGTTQDVEEYLQLYNKVESQKFAVIKVGGDVIRHELDTFAHALTFLHRAGLFPIVVHGAGPQMNELLEAEGVEPQYLGGMRVTDAATLKAARRVFMEVNLQLVTRLMELGTPARPVITGVFEAVVKDEELGYVGDITAVHPAGIAGSIADGCIPIVAPLAESSSGQILNINADVAARELAITMQPMKTIMINAKGGWIEPDGRKLPVIDLNRDYEEMASRDYTGRQGTLLKLKELKLILDSLPPSSSISLTSASGLVRELFTHKGSGTMVWKGEQIRRVESLEEAGLSNLEALSEVLQLGPGELTMEHWEYLNTPGVLQAVYISESRSVAAIVTQTPEGVAYLDSFAMKAKAKGSGLVDSMWEQVTADFPKLFWTTATTDEHAGWFFARSHGSQSVAMPGGKEYKNTVFWRGLEPEVAAKCVTIATTLPGGV